MDGWKRTLPALAGATLFGSTMLVVPPVYAAGDDGPGDDDPNGCRYDDNAAPATMNTANAALKAAATAQHAAAKKVVATRAKYQHALKTKTTKDNKPAHDAYVKALKSLASANKRVAAAKKRIAYLNTLANQCTAGVSAPTGLTATAGDASATLAWKAVSGATQYQVYRGTAKVASVTTTTFADSGLTNGTQYSYTVRATIGTQTSPASAPAFVTPAPPPPPHTNGSPLAAPDGLAASATAPLSGSMQLTWNAVPGATGYTVFRDGAAPTNSTTNSLILPTPAAGYHSYTVVATDGVAAETSPASAALSAGTFTGAGASDHIGRTVYGTITVSLVTSGPSKTITGCWATYPNSGDSASINGAAIPQLCAEVLSTQPAKGGSVAAVTGASGTSPAFNTSLQSALLAAGR